jgi:hypothetical protein
MQRICKQDDALLELGQYLCKDLVRIVKEYIIIIVDPVALEALFCFSAAFWKGADKNNIIEQIDQLRKKYQKVHPQRLEICRDRGYDPNDTQSLMEMIEIYPIVQSVPFIEVILNVKYDDLEKCYDYDIDIEDTISLLHNEQYSVKNWLNPRKLHFASTKAQDIFYIITTFRAKLSSRHDHKVCFHAIFKKIDVDFRDTIGYVVKVECDIV